LLNWFTFYLFSPILRCFASVAQVNVVLLK
jgi:hypothetical protein